MLQSKNKIKKRMRILEEIQSVLSAALGVQSNKNRERDLKEGSLWRFIILGIVFTTIFVLTLIAVVQKTLG